MNFRTLTSTILLGAFFSASTLQINDGLADNSPAAVSVAQPQNTLGVQFAKLKIPSIDNTLKELSRLDGRIVKIRNSLQNSRKSVQRLHNGNQTSFRKEIQGFIRSGAFTVTRKNGLPSLAYNSAKGTPRAKNIFQSLKKLERNVRISKTELPALQKDLERLKRKSQRMLKKAPTQARKAMTTGKIKPTELTSSLQKTSKNIKRMKQIPTHIDQTKNELVRTTKLLRNLF